MLGHQTIHSPARPKCSPAQFLPSWRCAEHSMGQATQPKHIAFCPPNNLRKRRIPVRMRHLCCRHCNQLAVPRIRRTNTKVDIFAPSSAWVILAEKLELVANCPIAHAQIGGDAPRRILFELGNPIEVADPTRVQGTLSPGH